MSVRDMSGLMMRGRRDEGDYGWSMPANWREPNRLDCSDHIRLVEKNEERDLRQPLRAERLYRCVALGLLIMTLSVMVASAIVVAQSIYQAPRFGLEYLYGVFLEAISAVLGYLSAAFYYEVRDRTYVLLLVYVLVWGSASAIGFHLWLQLR